MKTSGNSFGQGGVPMDNPFEPAGRHWHQPSLGGELVDPGVALATATERLLRRLSVVRQRVAATLSRWAARERSRRELEQMSEHMLRDIGLTRADVQREAAKPFWRD
jgi:uncharacterized protein YjiS (DUF1127 family)